MDERTVLRRAKEVLLERGWRNDGSYGNDDGEGSVCLVGALGVAMTDDAYALATISSEPAVLTRLAALCPSETADHWEKAQWTLLNFNDEYASFEDVIALLDKALASLEPSKTPELVA